MQTINPQHLLYKLGPRISLINYKGFNKLNLSHPVGSSKGGNTCGESLPNPFNFSYDFKIGISSKLKQTYP